MTGAGTFIDVVIDVLEEVTGAGGHLWDIYVTPILEIFLLFYSSDFFFNQHSFGRRGESNSRPDPPNITNTTLWLPPPNSI